MFGLLSVEHINEKKKRENKRYTTKVETTRKEKVKLFRGYC